MSVPTSCSTSVHSAADLNGLLAIYGNSRRSLRESSGFQWAADLLLRLSIFGFSQLSVQDQCQKTEEIRAHVVEEVTVEPLPEESDEKFRLRTFTELFKKLPMPEQNLLLSRIIKIFKRERQIAELVTWFTNQLDANVQEVLIRNIVHVAADNLPVPGETEEDFRLRRFTQLCRDYTDCAYWHLVDWKYKNNQEDGLHTSEGISQLDESSNWMPCRFPAFFLGFAVIWFKGQKDAKGQRRVIQQLSNGVITELFEEDVELERLKELCQGIYFHTLVEFLTDVEKNLRRATSVPHGSLLQPQDSASAAELLSHLAMFGFSLLPPEGQREIISSLFKKVHNFINASLADEDDTEEDEDDTEEFRCQTFCRLFNKVRVDTRIDVFKRFVENFIREGKLCEPILLFRQLSPSDQAELNEELLQWWFKQYSRSNLKTVIIEKSDKESEEDFRLRRFINLCSNPPVRHLVSDYFFNNEAMNKYQKRANLQISVPQSGSVPSEELPSIKEPRYGEFFSGVSTVWFKRRCANHPRNPIQVLVGKVDTIDKLPNESEEDFRLRRFIESFKRLEFHSQEYIVKYIENSVAHDLRGPETFPPKREEGKKDEKKSDEKKSDGEGVFYPELIKIKTPKLTVQGATSSTGSGNVAIAQGGTSQH